MVMKVMEPLSELFSFKGEVALITGSAVDIGKAMAYRFAEAGADLELIDINKKGLRALEELISECKKKGLKIGLALGGVLPGGLLI